MLAKADEVGADAIGMSGLLVKSTLIMRENLEEMNRRGKSDYLRSSSAARRSPAPTWSGTCASVYEGKVFYGKDAFEGLHTARPADGDQKRAGVDDPSFGTEPLGSGAPATAQRAAGRGRPCLPADAFARWSRPTTRCSSPRSSAPGSRRASPSTTSPRYLNETALFRNQWGYRPESGESRRRLQRAHPGRAARPPRRGEGGRRPRAPGRLGLLPRQLRRQRPRRLHRRRPPHRADALLASRASARSPISASPTSSGRSSPARCDYAAFQIATVGARGVGPHGPSCSPTTATSTTWSLHGLSVEMTEALAELWHRRIREEWGFADEDGPSLAGLFRQKYRGGRYSFGYPACPELEDNAKVVELLEAGRIGVTVARGLPARPRADDARHRLPPPEGEVLRRLSPDGHRSIV